MKRWLVGSAVVALSQLFCQQCSAVVVASANENTTSPDPTFPWNNVGIVNSSTGIYLGDRWVLTARHVTQFAAPIEFPGIGIFEPESDVKMLIENPTGRGLSEFTDLALFRLRDDPGLPPIRIASQTPAIGTEVYLVGNGRDREEDLTFWDADITPARNEWVETDESGEYSGYKTISSKTIRWGTNLIENDETLFFDFDQGHTHVIDTGITGEVIALITEFDREGYSNTFTFDDEGRIDTDYEAQAVLNDSGGGLFVLNDGNWELAGIINSVFGHSGQDDEGGPATRLNPLFGNVTFSANLADYRDFIISATGYQTGDFDSDGNLTRNDIDLLTGVMLSGVSPEPFDLNSDGVIDQEDRRIWVEELAFTYFGDSNLDGQFNSQDLVTVFQQASYEDSIVGNGSWLSGDWNGDREFGTEDLVLAFQSAAYENGPRNRGGDDGAIVVPEPAGAYGLMLTVIVGLMIFVRSSVMTTTR